MRFKPTCILSSPPTLSGSSNLLGMRDAASERCYIKVANVHAHAAGYWRFKIKASKISPVCVYSWNLTKKP